MGEFGMFIELHLHSNGKPVLVAVKNICYIAGDSESTVIGFSGDDDHYICVIESVEDIKKMFHKIAQEGMME